MFPHHPESHTQSPADQMEQGISLPGFLPHPQPRPRFALDGVCGHTDLLAVFAHCKLLLTSVPFKV